MSAGSAPAVRLERVTVRYGTRAALSSMDLTIAPGEFVALAGPNGSGKTTLLRTLLGFLPPESGSVELGGSPVGALSVRERARRAAWMPQEEAARDDVPLLQYVLYGRYARQGPMEGDGPPDVAAARAALSDVGLLERAHEGVLSLSGGERQRVTLARALAQAAPVLLLDEPTAHLDIGHQLDLLGRVRALATPGGTTVVAAMHDLNLAARFADRIVVLSRGHKVADGPPATVLSEELLERVWGVVGELKHDPRTGAPYLVPYRPSSSVHGPPPLGRGPVHVVGGGGAAAPLLRALAEADYRVTAGVLNLLDTDQEVAAGLGIPCAVEAPFAPIGSEAREAQRRLLEDARAVVVAPFPVGPSNLSNLEDLVPLTGRRPLLLLRRAPGVPWDFTGGSARRVEESLRSAGALEVDGIPALLRTLEQKFPAAPS